MITIMLWIVGVPVCIAGVVNLWCYYRSWRYEKMYGFLQKKGA